MASVFTRIINGELPGTFVWKDEDVVAFSSIAPLRPGHTLVVPRTEIDLWTDLPDELGDHLYRVARTIGRAMVPAFDAPRSGLLIAGFEVPHVHLHVFPAWGLGDFNPAGAQPVDPAELAAPAAALRQALRDAGAGEHVVG